MSIIPVKSIQWLKSLSMLNSIYAYFLKLIKKVSNINVNHHYLPLTLEKEFVFLLLSSSWPLLIIRAVILSLSVNTAFAIEEANTF
jgi:hypothetical protein